MKQHLSNLMESELEKAELVLAAKGLSQQVQDMTEKVAKMRVDDLMPLIDKMKETFGQAQAEQFQSAVDGALESLQDNLSGTKDQMENQANVLNGEMPADTEMGMPEPEGEPSDMEMEPEMGAGEALPDEEGGEELDAFGASDADAGGIEPLGRAKKESAQKKGRALSEKWGTPTKTPKSERGKYKGKTKAELKKMLSNVKASGPHKKGSKEYERQNELEFALRAKGGWGKVGESNVRDLQKKMRILERRIAKLKALKAAR